MERCTCRWASSQCRESALEDRIPWTTSGIRRSATSKQQPRGPIPRERGAVPDAFLGMGVTAENVADIYGVSRTEMDKYAVRSHELALAPRASGFSDDEIVPIEQVDAAPFVRDESPRAGSTVETLAGLGPAFREGGRVTAGNSCPLSDGAAGLALVDDRVARVSTPLQGPDREYGRARGVARNHGNRDRWCRAARRASSRPGSLGYRSRGINEAFAAMVIPTYRELGVRLEKVNPFGGAIALGRPFGMSRRPHHRNADSWIALSGWVLRTSGDVRCGGHGCGTARLTATRRQGYRPTGGRSGRRLRSHLARCGAHRID